MRRTAVNLTTNPAQVPKNTFVLDNGADTIKAGFASNEPESDTDTAETCHVIRNSLVRTRDRKTYIAAQSADISQWSEAVFRRPIEHGQIVNWEAQKEIWDYSFFDEKSAVKNCYIEDPSQTSLILTETPNAMPILQKYADEIVMEEWGFGGYLRTVGPSLNAFNDLHPLFEDPTAPKSKSTIGDLPMECLLVIDSGYSYTTITPVFGGQPIQRAIKRMDFGGKHLTNLLKEVISIRHFDLHQDTKIVNDIKEDVCFVSQDFKADMERTWKGRRAPPEVSFNPNAMITDLDISDQNIRIDYVLPDGVHIPRGYPRPHDPSRAAAKKRKLAAASSDAVEVAMTLGNERFTVPEIIFNPSDIGSKQPGLADCIIQSLSVLPPLIQATMLANTLVVGGNANLPGFVERVESELRMRIKSEWPVRVKKMQNALTSTWLGGTRLARFHRDTFQNYAVSKEQYFEHGSTWVARKFTKAPHA